MTDKIKEIIIQKHINSNGSNGYTEVQLINDLNITKLDLSVILNDLYTEKLIRIRKAINGRMVFATQKLLKQN